ncbi:glycosyltransferase [uncultured Shewanella sp.]|uniref:glycosyltransferase n=1 Tax=uncultured Shewanella sp. TaxID=173975 RepID=UPI00260565B9|nr:glycosyltransferase [uncultured Shewanella sp.]
MKLSFIIPYGMRSFDKQHQRLLSLVSTLVSLNDCEIIIHDMSVDSAHQRLTDSGLMANAKVTYMHEPLLFGDVFSPAYARNQGVKHSKGEYLFFMDVDLTADITFLQSLIGRANKLKQISTKAFEMFPCFYLTQNASLNQNKNNFSPSNYLLSYMQGENSIIEGIALASSCLLVNKNWFNRLGGFDESFIGHGGEDLFLICQLAYHFPLAPLPSDFKNNTKTLHPANYKGFRRYLSVYALEHLFEQRFFLHSWHPRPLTHNYYRRRKYNDLYLMKKIQDLLTNQPEKLGNTYTNLVDNSFNIEHQYEAWLVQKQEEYHWHYPQYSGLFQWKAKQKIKRPLWRKIRKLYVNPRLFTKDLIDKHKKPFKQNQ